MRFQRLFFMAAAVFLLLPSCREVPDPKGPDVPPVSDDPILEVTLPGAYGVEGSNETQQDGFQSSLLEYPEGVSWRMLHPASRKVVSLSGLPASFQKGDKIDFLYRVSERGITRVNHLYTEVEVLQVTDSLIWLKKDDHTYFVLEP